MDCRSFALEPTGRVPNIGAASLLRGDCKRYFFRDLVWLDFTRSSWVCISWRAASTSTSTWKGGQRRTDAAGRWCKRSWSSTPFQVVHFLEDNDVCLFVILPEGWKHPQISLSVVTFLRAGNRKQWTNSLSKQRVWRMRPASALNLNQDSHEAILYSKSRGRWARQRPRRRVRGCDDFEGKGLVRDHGRGERSMYNILSRVTFLCLRVQHHHHRHQNLLQGWLSILLLS